MRNLDIDLLRTLVVAADLGSFARAAERLGRTQAAISLQMRRLEDRVGKPLLRREGRRSVLTENGERLLEHARRLVRMNDEAVADLSAKALAGTVRLGLPQDVLDTSLPQVLGRFAQDHPGVVVDLRVDRNIELLERLGRGRLDLALVFAPLDASDGERIAKLPMAWIASRGFRYQRGATLPLAVFEPPCVFRSPAVTALEKAGIRWRLAMTSPSLAGLWAGVRARLGVTVRAPLAVPPDLVVLGREARLPRLPVAQLVLHAGREEGSPAVQHLRALLREALRELIPSGR
jgi:DNA-binding transcriptional LysR family regulator